MATRLPNGRRLQVQRYGSGHWHGLLWGQRTLVDLERDALHRETLRRSGALSRRSRYDARSRLSTTELERGTQLLHERRYGSSPAGHLLGLHDSRSGFTTYTYDPVGQLLQARTSICSMALILYLGMRQRPSWPAAISLPWQHWSICAAFSATPSAWTAAPRSTGCPPFNPARPRPWPHCASRNRPSTRN